MTSTCKMALDAAAPRTSDDVGFAGSEVEKETIPEIVPVSDNSHSTVDSNTVDESTLLREPLIRMVTDSSIPSMVLRRDDDDGDCNDDQLPMDSSMRSQESSDNMLMDCSQRTSSSFIDASSSSRRSRIRSVRFGTVTTTEFAMTLGNHPDTQDGPALTIEWTPQSVEHDTVDHYEETRAPRKRDLESLKIAPFHREMYLLRIVGVTREAMEESIRAAKDVRRKRDETVRKMKNEKFEMAVQSLQRKTARLFFGKTLYPSAVQNDSDDDAVQSTPPSSSRDEDKKQHHKNHKSSPRASPRFRGRRGSFRKGSSDGVSCPGLSASTHPRETPPRSDMRRVVSMDYQIVSFNHKK